MKGVLRNEKHLWVSYHSEFCRIQNGCSPAMSPISAVPLVDRLCDFFECERSALPAFMMRHRDLAAEFLRQLYVNNRFACRDCEADIKYAGLDFGECAGLRKSLRLKWKDIAASPVPTILSSLGPERGHVHFLLENIVLIPRKLDVFYNSNWN